MSKRITTSAGVIQRENRAAVLEQEAWLGRGVLPSRTCSECGEEFQTRQHHKRCPGCRGLVSIDKAQAHIRELRAACDTLIYFGDLRLAVVPAARLLRPGDRKSVV